MLAHSIINGSSTGHGRPFAGQTVPNAWHINGPRVVNRWPTADPSVANRWLIAGQFSGQSKAKRWPNTGQSMLLRRPAPFCPPAPRGNS
eukprot:8266341-Lingulodinium_polyedra.AAC.1